VTGLKQTRTAMFSGGDTPREVLANSHRARMALALSGLFARRQPTRRTRTGLALSGSFTVRNGTQLRRKPGSGADEDGEPHGGRQLSKEAR
jgi:hypothetical protein